MSVASLIAWARLREADLADTTGTLQRRGALGAFNPATASYGPPTLTTIYAGPGLVHQKATTLPDAEETEVVVNAYLVKLPFTVDAHAGDVWTVTASAHNPTLVGQSMRVVDIDDDEWQVCRRLNCTTQEPGPT